jgi:preprotein translocase subunit SecG
MLATFSGFIASFLLVLFLIICVLLILVVLLQKGRGGGLGAAFGGGGGSAFGTKTGDVLTWVTIVLTALFLIVCILATTLNRPDVLRVDTPILVIGGKSITTSQEVEIPSRWESVSVTSATKGAKIYFTRSDAEVTQKSTPYGSAERVRPGQTLRIRAFRSGAEPSETLVVSFVLKRLSAPTFDPPAKGITEPTDVKILCEREKAIVRYTLDGAEPTEDSLQYEDKPVSVQPGQTLRARAFPEAEAEFRPSDVAEAVYVNVALPERPASANPAVPETAPPGGE